MGALSTFKVMKSEDFGGDTITFRTSRVCSVLGFLFLVAGLGIILQLWSGKHLLTMPWFCVICFVVSLGFIMAGLILVSYRKYVTLSKTAQKIELTESSILGVRATAFHFNEITNFELTKDCECLFSTHANLWVIKAYVEHGKSISVEKLFASISPVEAKKAAETLSFCVGRELVISCKPNERLIFSHIN